MDRAAAAGTAATSSDSRDDDIQRLSSLGHDLLDVTHGRPVGQGEEVEHVGVFGQQLRQLRVPSGNCAPKFDVAAPTRQCSRP